MKLLRKGQGNQSLKEGLIQICLFMLGGQWILFLQCGKRYEKITKIVLELLGISLMITTLGKSIGKMDFTDYLTKLQQYLHEFSTSENQKDVMSMYEFQRECDDISQLFSSTLENETTKEIKFKINNSKIGGEYSVYAVSWKEYILVLHLTAYENSDDGKSESDVILPVKPVVIEINGVDTDDGLQGNELQGNESQGNELQENELKENESQVNGIQINGLQEANLREQIADILGMDENCLEVILE